MDKKDVMYIAAALALVLVIALVIKPVVTGQPLESGIPVSTTTLDITIITTEAVPQHMPPLSPLTASVTAITTTPQPTWNPAVTQTVGFVNPSNYGISTNDTDLKGTRIDTPALNNSMITFATFGSEQGASGTTNILYIPFPYWELEYTVDPTAENVPEGKFEVTPAPGSGIAMSGVSGSYSTVKPEFTIQVMDGDDPNRIVRTITPPGGIDLALWTSGKSDGGDYPTRASKYAAQVSPDVTPVDPRPWIEKFYEGQRNYYFVIAAKGLNSYSLKINVPMRYVGKY